MKFFGFMIIVMVLSFFSISASAQSKKFNLDFKHVPGELIVTFVESSSFVDTQMALATEGASIIRSFSSSNSHLVRFAASLTEVDLLRIAEDLVARSDVQAVEANTYYYLNEKIPNDPLFSNLYNMKNTGQTGGLAGADIGATYAWQISTGSRSVKVGIIDTGVDYTHPDLAANYWTNPGETGLDEQGNDKRTNGIDDDGNGYVDDWRGWDFINNDNDPMDDHGHGSHCAGVIGAVGDDGFGIAGVNWQVSLVGLKIFSKSGATQTDAIIAAIEYATGLGLNLTSNSWGGGAESFAIKAAIADAEAKGILFIAAAGNSGVNTDITPNYPSGYNFNNIISVAATDHRDQLASFSNFGATTVHVAAPGVNIDSTVPGGKYQKMSGTSMATPHVAGLAALIMAAYPDLSYSQVKDRILNTAKKLPRLSGKTSSGGRIAAASALEHDDEPPGEVRAIQIGEAGLTDFLLSWQMAGDDGDIGAAANYHARISAHPLTSEAEWHAAMIVQLTVLSVDENATAPRVYGKVTNLDYNTSGYVTLMAQDNMGNLGPISESVFFRIKETNIIYQTSGDNLNGIEADSPWGIEEIDGRRVFSDSPGANYQNNIDISLTLPEILPEHSIANLEFAHRYDLENRFDVGYVEISRDSGKSWTQLASYTSVLSAWQRMTIALDGNIAAGESFKLRFRLKSDSSLTREGWWIRDISIISLK